MERSDIIKAYYDGIPFENDIKDSIFYEFESKTCKYCYWNSIVEPGMCNLLNVDGMEYCSKFEHKKER